MHCTALCWCKWTFEQNSASDSNCSNERKRKKNKKKRERGKCKCVIIDKQLWLSGHGGSSNTRTNLLFFSFSFYLFHCWNSFYAYGTAKITVTSEIKCHMHIFHSILSFSLHFFFEWRKKNHMITFERHLTVNGCANV